MEKNKPVAFLEIQELTHLESDQHPGYSSTTKIDTNM